MIRSQLIHGCLLFFALACAREQDDSKSNLAQTRQPQESQFANNHSETSSNELLTVFSAGQTIFPSLKNYCSTNASEDVLSSFQIPYNSATKSKLIWGYVREWGEVAGCGSDSLSLTGRFVDLAVGRNDQSTDLQVEQRETCTGELTVKQHGNTMNVTWKVDTVPTSPSTPANGCMAGGQSFTVNLTRTRLNDLKTQSLSFYEYNLSASRFDFKILPASGLFLMDSSLQNKLILLKQGTHLRAKYCDRGGADFPEAGICYRISPNGTSFGFLTDGSSPATRLPFGGGYLPLLRKEIAIVPRQKSAR